MNGREPIRGRFAPVRLSLEGETMQTASPTFWQVFWTVYTQSVERWLDLVDECEDARIVEYEYRPMFQCIKEELNYDEIVAQGNTFLRLFVDHRGWLVGASDIRLRPMANVIFEDMFAIQNFRTKAQMN